MSRQYELGDASVVVVIGSGAGGGVLGAELARRGVDVVCLEAGPRLSLADFVNDEALMFRRLTWLDPREGSGDLNPNFPTFVCKTVGGTTVHWTALAMRPLADEFAPLSKYGSIPGADLMDWPIPYDVLARYFDRAESMMGVAGTNDWPYHPGSNNYKVMEAGARRLGYREVDMGHLAINSVARDGRPQCRQIGFCKSGCPIGAKWSTLYTEIPKAEATDHFELRPECMAVKLNHGPDGRITGVVYADSKGVLHEQKARAVCLACNAIETPRLLLNSASGRYPDGIGNANGLVGRYYMRHVFAGVAALMPGPVNFHRGIQQAGSVSDQRYHQPARGFASGYHIEGAPLSPERMALLLDPDGWGSEYTALIEQYSNFAACLIVGEDLADRNNHVRLHTERRDRYGLAVPIVHYEYHANSIAMREHAQQAATAIYEAVGAKRVFRFGAPPATHNLGTCRMAKDEKDGVCDANGRVFGTSNLFISDGSQFVSATTANPTLTIIALALRQSERLANSLSRLDL
ncbi:MAG: GMC family oxidoreductase [Woeseia sp.]